jgi:phage terminase large subunit-like protein
MDEPWRRWTPAAQEKALEALRGLSDHKWKPFYCPRPGCDGKPHEAWNFPHARADQHPPKGDWLTWLIRGGRGSGKTRTGAEWTHRRTAVSPRIALVAPTGPDGRAIMVEGESGILATSPPGQTPQWEPSKRELTWPNGAKGFLYSAEEPDRLRGPQHYDAWIDEPAHMPLIEDVWSMLLFGLRLVNAHGNRICATTTPKPTKWMKDLIADSTTISVVASTYANIDNLAPTFAAQVLKRYEGTRLGRQEIHGEVLTDVEGALWEWQIIEDYRVEKYPEDMDRIVVGIDPAGTSSKASDETGIVVCGAKGDDYYVLSDLSGRYTPNVWGSKAVTAYTSWDADAIVPETNYGGEMVVQTLRSIDERPRIITVHSRRGKVLRAEPIVALYERGKVHHVGLLTDLEDQMTSWLPGTDSPDRVDALVHALTQLARQADPTAIASPTQLRR